MVGVLRSAPLALCLGLAGCAGAAGSATGSEAVTVVATHSILGDMLANIAGDGVTVESVMPVGADPHEFEASAQQIEAMNGADLLVANGLGFEEQLLEAIEAAEADGVPVLELGEDLDPIPFEGEHEEGEHHEGEEHAEEGSEAEHAEEETAEEGEHGNGSEDPHWFQDPDRAAEAARLIGARLAEVTGDEGATERAEAYAAELEDLAAELEGTLGAVPEDRRKLVTNHDAFGYFADRFDFEVVGTVIPSGTTLAEPSAREVQELAETIEREGVPAIFAENTQPEELADTLVAEVDVDVEVVELYSDSLGEQGSDGATYAELLRANAERVADALAG